jgi:hypothetical protein
MSTTRRFRKGGRKRCSTTSSATAWHRRGSSSSVPLQSNVTPHGREANRRVVFKVDLIILNKGNAQ